MIVNYKIDTILCQLSQLKRNLNKAFPHMNLARFHIILCYGCFYCVTHSRIISNRLSKDIIIKCL